ncbi:MAG: DEAD/DEAH box helicase [Candidatus Cloacimonetes bacterium]|nr:DEAD/DEAH box helicase [Candidatus Cloacimonadota bacterium]
MDIHHQIGLDSYDRLFPNQDLMPQGGFGNLIALPLQKKARKHGNSLFLDNDFHPVADQWAFLSLIKRISIKNVQELVNELTKNSSLFGNLKDSSEEDILTWDQEKPPVAETEILPEKVIVTLSNMIFIEKEGLSHKMLSRIIRIAAFQNPEFYKTQALRLSVHNIPRVINLSFENIEHIAILRGCKEEILKLFDQVNIKPELIDLTYSGTKQNFVFKGRLRKEQLEAGYALLQSDNGILAASTAFGKTIVALWLIAQRNVNTLIIVHRRQLLQQWKERISCFLDIPVKEIGEIGSGKDKRTAELDVALIQSLNRKGVVMDYVQEYGLVIVDECHHISAYSFEQVLKKIKAKYVYGLTATLTRKDGRHPIVTMQCGPVRYKTSNKVQAVNRSFTHQVIIRYTNFRLPEYLLNTQPKITELYQALIEDIARNDLILDDIISSISEGRSPLILTERTAHVDFFAGKLEGFAKNIVVLKGGLGKKQIKAIFEKLNAIPENEERVIIATGKYIGEGFDDSRLDTLFLTLPISWKGTLQQYAGRLHRSHEAKTEVIIYDYVDKKIPAFSAMFKKREKGYEWMGYQIKDK